MPRTHAMTDPATRGTILVVDDENAMRLALREVLRRDGWDVELASSGEQALETLEGDAVFAALMTDHRMGGMTGLELVRAAHALRPALPIVMMTAYGTVEDAVTAMKEGARDYLLKPFSFETVVEVIGRLTAPTEEPPSAADAGPGRARAGGDLIAEAPRFRELLAMAEDVADADATVLLTGESGTGKEVLARFIHERSGRRGTFVAVNCAALPEGLLESELFGHEKGAFTGAVLARKGRFEQADGGTLLLDEVSEMPLALQAKLLRVLQEKEIQPVGAASPVRIDARVIATSNRDMREAVADGSFRQDLYYRLNVIALELPPLRERREDILPLAEFFLQRYRRRGRPEQRLADDVIAHLRTHAWPGNVRELENLMERACLLARAEVIQMDDLHLGAAPPVEGVGELPGLEGLTLEEVEKHLILRTLDRHDGNRTRTAESLGVSVRTIRNKLHQYGLREQLAGAGS